MPLTDLVHNLNARGAPLPAGVHSTAPFVAARGQVFVHYANLRLESRFVPYVETTSGRVLGHAALLRTVGLGNGRELESGAVFALPTDAYELVHLDRLVRTLHTLNYLTHPEQGDLLLKVHPRHVASVPADHGLAFEEILRPCGLLPRQITLELESGGTEDNDHLKRAIANYKSRGYGIAIGRFGNGNVDFGFLREIRPAIVRLDRTLLASGRSLHRLVEGMHDLGIRIMAEGTELLTRRRVEVAPIDLLQLSDAHRRPSTPCPPAGSQDTQGGQRQGSGGRLGHRLGHWKEARS